MKVSEFGHTDLRNEYKKVPLPDLRVGVLAWHYTDAAGLLGILSNHAFWASEASSLNDTGEVAFGEAIAKEVWDAFDQSRLTEDQSTFLERVFRQDDREPTLSESLYVLSASPGGDLLNQWMHYAGQGGFAIGIRTADRLVPRGPHAETEDANMIANADGRTVPAWSSVVYDTNEQQSWTLKLIQYIATTLVRSESDSTHADCLRYARMCLNTLTTSFKDPGFWHEQEIRYLGPGAKHGSKEFFRTRRGRIISYLEMVSTEDSPMVPLGPERRPILPLAQIVCAPGTTAVEEASIRKLLKTQGYGEVSTEISKMPYRYGL